MAAAGASSRAGAWAPLVRSVSCALFSAGLPRGCIAGAGASAEAKAAREGAHGAAGKAGGGTRGGQGWGGGGAHATLATLAACGPTPPSADDVLPRYLARGKQAQATTGKAKKPQLPGKTRTDVVAGTNILKAGGEDVKLLPDEAYPDWLWDIGKPQPSLEDLREVVKDGEGLFELSGAERVRYLRLERREDIRAANKKKSK